MANRTAKEAQMIRGTNPQHLIEKIIRTRILDSIYWKEECFALTAELLVDKALELKYIGGVYGGNVKVAPFLCLVLKMLQIQPEKDIIVEFITQTDSKYVRALGAFYMRLTGTALDCYKYLEPLFCDYAKMKRQKRDGAYEIVHMDEFVGELLLEERSLDVILPRIAPRAVLESTNEIEPRELMDFECGGPDEDMEEEEEGKTKGSSPKKEDRKRERSTSRGKTIDKDKRRRDNRDKSEERDRERDRKERRRHRSRSRERRRSKSRERHRSRSRDRRRSRSKDRRRETSRDRDDRRKDRRREKRRSRSREDDRGECHKKSRRS